MYITATGYRIKWMPNKVIVVIVFNNNKFSKIKYSYILDDIVLLRISYQ
jgi:hypothetical protein